MQHSSPRISCGDAASCAGQAATSACSEIGSRASAAWRWRASIATEAAAGGNLTLHPATVARYLDEISRLHELLLEGNGMVAGVNAEAIAIVRSLIREVVVHPADDRGFEVEIIGDLAALTGGNGHISELFAQCSQGGSGGATPPIPPPTLSPNPRRLNDDWRAGVDGSGGPLQPWEHLAIYSKMPDGLNGPTS